MLREQRIQAAWLIELDRPERRNALGKDMVKRIEASLSSAAADPSVRGVILASAVPGVFCAGGDLKELTASGVVPDDVLALRSLTDAIAQSSLPVIAAVDGEAIGGGTELALACDRIVVGAAARFRFEHARLGVTTAWGTTERLRQSVGFRKAAELLMWAAVLDGASAVELGLASDLCERPVDRALTLVGDLGPLDRDAIAGFKRLLRSEGGVVMREAEAALFRSLWGSKSHRKRLMERTRPT